MFGIDDMDNRWQFFGLDQHYAFGQGSRFSSKGAHEDLKMSLCVNH